MYIFIITVTIVTSYQIYIYIYMRVCVCVEICNYLPTWAILMLDKMRSNCCNYCTKISLCKSAFVGRSLGRLQQVGFPPGKANAKSHRSSRSNGRFMMVYDGL